MLMGVVQDDLYVLKMAMASVVGKRVPSTHENQEEVASRRSEGGRMSLLLMAILRR
jgi:hypothetical protein